MTGEVRYVIQDKQTIPLTTMRRAIARTVTVSKQTIPHFYVEVDADVTGVLASRRNWGKTGEPVPSINHFLLKAVAQALVEVPELNASYSDEGITYYASVNLGIVVAVDDGILIPVIRNAERLSLVEIAAQSRLLAEKARRKRLSPEDCTGPTFTVSNMGMLGVKAFAAIIPPPQSGILAVGKVMDLPQWDGQTWRPVSSICLTLSVDHRVVDGVNAAKFLQRVRTLLANPQGLVGGERDGIGA